MKNYLICILIVIVICGGCTQKNSITGDYRNEANEAQYIVFGETGTFSHYNYNNTHGLFRNGNYTVNNNLLTLYYTDGQISEFYIDEYELIPTNENKSDSIDKIYEKRFEKRLEQ
jgi:Lipocalin-like domain